MRSDSSRACVLGSAGRPTRSSSSRPPVELSESRPRALVGLLQSPRSWPSRSRRCASPASWASSEAASARPSSPAPRRPRGTAPPSAPRALRGGRLERGQSRVVLVAGRTRLLVLLAALADRDIQLGPRCDRRSCSWLRCCCLLQRAGDLLRQAAARLSRSSGSRPSRRDLRVDAKQLAVGGVGRVAAA